MRSSCADGSGEDVLKPAMERAFSPWLFCCFIPGALPQVNGRDGKGLKARSMVGFETTF